jgi:DNA polymerase III delta' subunit
MLSSVIGHSALVTWLKRIHAGGTLPHAVIFEGQAHVGRLTLARALAQTFLCPTPVNQDACGACNSCRMFHNQVHPDLVELPESDQLAADFPVDLIREEIVAKAPLSALQGHGRVFILPDADRLKGSAANALLKILEEPPRQTLIVMTVQRANALLKTIRSRSQIFRLGLLSTEEIARILQKSADLSPTEAARAAEGAQGVVPVQGHDPGADAPLEALTAIVDSGYKMETLGILLDALAQQAKPLICEDITEAAAQRRVLRRWLDQLLNELTQRLRKNPDETLVARMEHIIIVRDRIGLNLTMNTILETLALEGTT